MPSTHATLSPSAAERWIQCPASIRMAEKAPRGEESVYAAEGTLAHELAEIKANFTFGKMTEKEYRRRIRSWEERTPADQLEDMHQHTDAYVHFIEDRLALFPTSQVFFEQRLATGVPRCWGTSDTVIVSPQHVEIIDLKYGQGVEVDAVGNPQLRLYAVGALDSYGDLLGETEVVRITVFQPRLNSVSSEEITPADLRIWRDSLLPIAEEALSDDARFGPSESACRWCPAAGICRARMEKLAAEDFSIDPDVLTEEELGDVLGRLAEVKDWVNAVESTALNLAYSEGRHIPGWKVVRSGARRVIKDESAALQKLEEAHVPITDAVTSKLKGIGDLEKLIKPRKLEDVLGDLVLKTEGRPALVRDDDKRPALDRNAEARKEFS